jgi:(heptosyl)LPS beta-1,4-glucosyltransferase
VKNACARRKSSRVPRRAQINPQDITAVVLARNEERNLARALDSLPAGTSVLVIDHESTDATAAVARERGAQVIVRSFDGFVNARRFALSQVHTRWTLMIDADEALDVPLRNGILAAPEDFDGYSVSRTTFYCGRPLRMWRGEILLRLFKTERVRLESAPAAGGEAHLHERWVSDGPTAILDGTLLHYSYPTPDVYRVKYETYTDIEAAGISPSRGKYVTELLRAPLRFLWYAIARGAALDGAAGLRVAWSSAFYLAVVQRKALAK